MEKTNQNRHLQHKFSIRYKFLLVTTALLFICVSAYLLMANFIFKSDKTQLVYEYNLSSVKNISGDLQSTFEKVDDKLKLLVWSYNQKSESLKKNLNNLLSTDEDIAAIFESRDYKSLTKSIFYNKQYLKTYELEGNGFQKKIVENRKIPFEKILKNGQLVWNATFKGGPPLVGVGRSVILKTPKGIPYKQFAMIAFVRMERFINKISDEEFTEIRILNSEGEVLVDKDFGNMLNVNKVSDLLFQKAKESPVQASVMKLGEGKASQLAAFAKSYNNKLYVISSVSDEDAFLVVRQFISRSILFAMIVLTAAFIAAILFSRSLVRPIVTLTNGMQKVSEGELETRINIKTNDEIESLAHSFNFMIGELQTSRHELLEMNENLEIKVKDRTHQLEVQNQAVKHAQEALIRTTRLAAVGEIAGQAAHEVLNPLTSIISRLHRMHDQQLDSGIQEVSLLKDISSAWEEDVDSGGFEKLIANWSAKSTVNTEQNLWQEDLKNITDIRTNISKQMNHLKTDTQFLLKESQRINKIIQSMRTMSVIHAEKEKINLHNLLDEGVNVMADLADKLNIEVNLHKNAKDDLVFIDGDEFTQAFTNLLRNALQAVYEKQKSGAEFVPAITISTLTTKEHIEVYVQDNGIGIERDNHKKLFENQFTTKSKEEGTGLGLSISRRFIRAFGGDIVLDNSALGQGSTFVIKLPLYNEKLEEIA